MSYKINPIHHQTLPLQPPTSKRPDKSGQVSFKDALHHATKEKVTVSKHAQKRLDERNIQITEQNGT